MRCRWLLLPLLLATVTGCGPGGSGSAGPSDEIVLETPDGSEVRLMETIKRPGATATLVNFWSIGCVGCRAELPHLAKLYEKHRDAGFNVIAVNAMDTPDAVSKFVSQHNLPFTVVLNGDGPNDLLQKYNVIAYPTNLIFDSSGKMVERIEGWEEFTMLRALKKAGIGTDASNQKE
ncbi:MAG: TlpA family protein disulfide reductase [Fimbriimonadia bacterium]